MAAHALDQDRWPTEVSPHVRNRRLVPRKVLDPELGRQDKRMRAK